MTIQEAARSILQEAQKPMKSTDIAASALQRGLVFSDAQDPVASLSQTIEKNIRSAHYNSENLKFIQVGRKRLVGLASMVENPAHSSPAEQPLREITANVPLDTYELIKTASDAGIASTFDETVVKILKMGLPAVAEEVKVRLKDQMRKFDGLV